MEPTRGPWSIDEATSVEETGSESILLRIRFAYEEWKRRVEGLCTDRYEEDQANVRLVESARQLMDIASSLDLWERDPDRYGGDLADLAHEAREILAFIRKGHAHGTEMS